MSRIQSLFFTIVVCMLLALAYVGAGYGITHMWNITIEGPNVERGRVMIGMAFVGSLYAIYLLMDVAVAVFKICRSYKG